MDFKKERKKKCFTHRHVHLINKTLLKPCVESHAEVNPSFHSDENIYGSQIKQPYGLAFAISTPSMCVYGCACVCLKKSSTNTKKQSAYNRLTFFGHITNLFIYFIIPLQWASVFPEEWCTFKGNSDNTESLSSVCSCRYFFSAFPSFSHFLQIKCVFKEQSLLLLLDTYKTKSRNKKYVNDKQSRKERRCDGQLKCGCKFVRMWVTVPHLLEYSFFY